MPLTDDLTHTITKQLYFLPLLCLLLLSPRLDAGSDDAPQQIRGSLLIAGGALARSNASVHQRLIGLAGGLENARIGIIPAASSRPAHNSLVFRETLTGYGLRPEQIIILPLAVANDPTTEEDESFWVHNRDNPEVAALLNSCSFLWFIGGDQTRIMEVLKNDDDWTVVGKALHEANLRGVPIGGISAGAAVMSDIMLAGGDSLGAMLLGVTENPSFRPDQEFRPAYVSRGTGLFPFGVVDQNFERRARHGRLLAVLLDAREKGREQPGFGIGEDTALIADFSTGMLQVLGNGHVTVFSVNSAVGSFPGRVRGVLAHVLSHGDTYDTINNRPVVAEGKTPTVGREHFRIPRSRKNGFWEPYASFQEAVSYGLLDNSEQTSVESLLWAGNGEGYLITVRQTNLSRGYWGYRDGQMDIYTSLYLHLEIEPVEVEIRRRQ